MNTYYLNQAPLINQFFPWWGVGNRALLATFMPKVTGIQVTIPNLYEPGQLQRRNFKMTDVGLDQFARVEGIVIAAVAATGQTAAIRSSTGADYSIWDSAVPRLANLLFNSEAITKLKNMFVQEQFRELQVMVHNWKNPADMISSLFATPEARAVAAKSAAGIFGTIGGLALGPMGGILGGLADGILGASGDFGSNRRRVGASGMFGAQGEFGATGMFGAQGDFGAAGMFGAPTQSSDDDDSDAQEQAAGKFGTVYRRGRPSRIERSGHMGGLASGTFLSMPYFLAMLNRLVEKSADADLNTVLVQLKKAFSDFIRAGTGGVDSRVADSYKPKINELLVRIVNGLNTVEMITALGLLRGETAMITQTAMVGADDGAPALVSKLMKIEDIMTEAQADAAAAMIIASQADLSRYLSIMRVLYAANKMPDKAFQSAFVADVAQWSISDPGAQEVADGNVYATARAMFPEMSMPQLARLVCVGMVNVSVCKITAPGPRGSTTSTFFPLRVPTASIVLKLAYQQAKADAGFDKMGRGRSTINPFARSIGFGASPSAGSTPLSRSQSGARMTFSNARAASERSTRAASARAASAAAGAAGGASGSASPQPNPFGTGASRAQSEFPR
jgi:hypothetical protein